MASTLRPISQAAALDAVDDAAAEAERAIRRRVAAAIRDLRSGADLGRLALEPERADAAFPWAAFAAALALVAADLAPVLEGGAGQAVGMAGVDAQDLIDSPGFRSREQGWLDAHVSEAVEQVVAASQAGARELGGLAEAVGLSPALVAALVGITAQQVATLRAQAVGLIADAATRRQVLDAVARRADQLARLRAEAIALSESLTAARAGFTLGWEEATTQGAIDANAWIQEWVARPAGACPICVDLDGRHAEIGEPWYSELVAGEVWDSAHPRCMCARILVRRAEVLAA